MNLDKPCAKDGCDRWASIMSPLCRYHGLLSSARLLDDPDQLESLRAELAEMSVASPEERQAQQRASRLRMLTLDYRAVARNEHEALELGATEADLQQARAAAASEWADELARAEDARQRGRSTPP